MRLLWLHGSGRNTPIWLLEHVKCEPLVLGKIFVIFISGASSAPVLAQVDFIEYKEVVGASIRSVGGEECYGRIERAISQAERLIAEGNFAEFSRRFKTCDEITDYSYDVWSMFGLFSNLFAGVVQYHR